MRVKIYFIRCENTPYVKVGFTRKSVKDRMAQMDGHCPFNLSVYKWFYVDNLKFEHSLHQILTDKYKRVKKEWFEMTDEDIDYVYNLYKDSFIGGNK